MNRPVTVVNLVLFHSDPAVVNRALDALVNSIPPPCRVQIHVNGDDGELGIKPELLAGVTVTRSPDNLGFAGGHNRLLASAFADGADVAVVHNPDLVLEPDALGLLVAACADNGHRLYGPLLERAAAETGEGTGHVDSLGIRWTRDARHLDRCQGEPVPPVELVSPVVAGISGACLAVPRAAYERIVEASGEFFDEDFIAYREDAELALRAGLLGVESRLVPAARGLHIRTQRGTSRGRDPLVDLLGVRNRFLILAKWGRRRPGWLPLSLLRDGLVLVAVLVRERSSLPGLRQAWQFRRKMRDKRGRVLAWIEGHPRVGP